MRLLHIASHGGRDPAHRELVALHIGQQRYLGMYTILASRSPCLDIYASACLGGQTVEDLDGNPSGLISGWFRRQARVVVAALVAVPDNWACVLALLTHQAMVREGLPLDRALPEGKRRLAKGAWYDDTEALLRVHAKAALAGQLKQRIEWYQRRYRANFFPECWQKQIEPELASWSLPDEQRLREELRGCAPQELAHRISDVLIDAWASHGRIPPEPALGTLFYGVLAFGEVPPEVPPSAERNNG